MLCLSPITQSVSFCFGLPLLLHSYPHYLSLQRVTSYNVSYPVLLSCSNYIHQRSLFFHLFQFIRASSFGLCCPADLLHPPPYPRLNSQVSTQSALEFCPIHCPNGRLGQDLGFGGSAFALKLPELLNTNLAAVRAKLGQRSCFPNGPRIWCPIGQ